MAKWEKRPALPVNGLDSIREALEAAGTPSLPGAGQGSHRAQDCHPAAPCQHSSLLQTAYMTRLDKEVENREVMAN